MDDAGPGQPSTFGGEISTPTMDRVLGEGIGFQPVPHHGAVLPDPGIAADRPQSSQGVHRRDKEFSNDWDALSGRIPKSCALGPEVLKDYGYAAAAWGKWHNAPAIEAGPTGPFEYWPTNVVRTSTGSLRASPRSSSRTWSGTPRSWPPPKTPGEGYHLNEDLADDAIGWLHKHKSLAPDKPFFMYWASGAIHGPHHAPKEYIDKYRGKFDDGWDAYRERVFERAKEKGWIPAQHAAHPAAC